MNWKGCRRRLVAMATTAVACGGLVVAVPEAGAQSDPLSDPAAFADPPADVRPKIRWWWSTPYEAQEFREEIRAFAEAGFGGAEVAFNADGWGTAEQRAMLRESLLEAQRAGIKLDMTLGAEWPVRTPTTGPGSGLAEQELQYGRTDLAGPSVFEGVPPRPFDDPENARGGKLIAVTAARVISEGPPVTEPGTPPERSTVLDPTSLTDLTPRLRGDGTLRWQVPEGEWILFGFWQRDAAEGVMDHLNLDATRAVASYLDEHQIGAENASLLPVAARHFFEDSLELDVQELLWTERFAEEFEQRRGYDPTKFLPLFFIQGQNRYWVPDQTPPADFDLPNGAGDRLRHDYFETLTDLYIDYHIAGFAEWARTHGMQYRTQPAFGNAFDVSRSARAVARLGGIADDESLNAGDPAPYDEDDPFRSYGFVKTPQDWQFAMDHYRTVVGGSHQGGQNEVSSELGAVFFEEFMTGLEDYEPIMDKQWAAGLTRPIVHGYAYQAPGSPWPGAQRFFGIVSASWHHRTWPQWPHFRPLNDYWARGSLVLEQGKPRTDVAIYRDGFVTTAANYPPSIFGQVFSGQATFPLEVPHNTPFFHTRPLERRGYTLEYLDPVGVREPAAAGDGVLYPDGPGYRALIIDERALPEDTATGDRPTGAARSGRRLRGIPARPGNQPPPDVERGSSGAARRGPSTAGAERRPRRRPGHVARALARLGVQPAARWSRNLPVFSQRRQIDGTEYWYLWNAGSRTEHFRASFHAAGTPSRLDLWTGEITPLAVYRRTRDRTRVPLTLRPSETTVIAFRRHGPRKHVIATDAEDVVHGDGTVEIRDTRAGRRIVRFSDGSTRRARLPTLRSPLTVSAWHLRVDAATPGRPAGARARSDRAEGLARDPRTRRGFRHGHVHHDGDAAGRLDGRQSRDLPGARNRRGLHAGLRQRAARRPGRHR